MAHNFCDVCPHMLFMENYYKGVNQSPQRHTQLWAETCSITVAA